MGQLVQREGQKFIDDQGTDFFFLSILSHSSSLLGFEFGVQTSVTLSKKYCHQEESMPSLELQKITGLQQVPVLS